MIGLTLFRSAKSLELKQDLICFEPVEINLNTDLKKEFEMILKEKINHLPSPNQTSGKG